MSEYIVNSLIIAAGCVVILPLVGMVIGFITKMVLSKIFGIISPSGKLYLFIVNRLTFPGVMIHELGL